MSLPPVPPQAPPIGLLVPQAPLLAPPPPAPSYAAQLGSIASRFGGWLKFKCPTPLANATPYVTSGVKKTCSVAYNYVLKPATTEIAIPLVKGTFNRVVKPLAGKAAQGYAIGQNYVANTTVGKVTSAVIPVVASLANQAASAVAQVPVVASAVAQVNAAHKSVMGGVKASVLQAAAQAINYGASFLVKPTSAHIDAQRKVLLDKTGNKFFEKILTHGTTTIVKGIETNVEAALKDELSKRNLPAGLIGTASFSSIMKILPEAIEGVLISACANILANVPASAKTGNPLHDIVTHLVNITGKHIHGDAQQGILSIKSRLSAIEKNQDPVQRQQQLCELFSELHKELIYIALPPAPGSPAGSPPSFDSLGFGATTTWLLNTFALKHVQNPAGFIELYRMVLDPVCDAEARTAQLNETPGGQVLLHMTKFACEKGPGLLFQLLGETSPIITEALLPRPAHNPAPTPDEKLIIAEQLECHRRMTKYITEIAVSTPAPKGTVNPSAPQLAAQGLEDLGGTVIHSVLTKFFLNLATENGQKPLGPNEDPLPRVVVRLKDIFKGFYQQHAVALKDQFLRFEQAYNEHKVKSRRLEELYAKPKKLAELEAKGVLANPVEESKRLADIQNLKAWMADPIDQSNYHAEIRAIKTWMSNWKISKERKDLIENVFKPISTTLLEASGMNHEDGFRLKIGPLNGIIQDSIPEGFCVLFELAAVDSFPGLMAWMDPERSVKEKADQLDKATGNPAFSAIAKAFAPLITQNFLPGVFVDNSESWAKQMMDDIDFKLKEANVSDDLRLSNPNNQKHLAHLISISIALFKNIGNRNPATDELWKFGCVHVEEAILDLFLANCSGANPNPILAVTQRGLEALMEFQNTEGAALKAAYAQLPENPTEAQLKALYDTFERPIPGGQPNEKKNFFETELFDKLAKITGLDILLNDGKLAVFNLDRKIRSELSFKLFIVHLRFNRHNPKPEDIFDQLCAALYDKDKFLKKLSGAAPAANGLAYIHAQSIDPAGKTPQQRNEIWKASGATEHAEIAREISNFFTDFIGTSVQPLLAKNSDAVTEKLASQLSLQDPQAQGVLKLCIETLAGSNSDLFNALWPLAKGFLNMGISQVIANTLETSSPLMPPVKGEHRHWTLLGDLAARISAVVGDCMQTVGQKKAEVATLKAEIKQLTGVAGQEQQLAALHVRIQAIYKSLTDGLIAIVKGSSPNQDPLSVLPITDTMRDKLWEVVIPEKLGDVLIDMHDTMTPEVKPMQEELFDIYKSNHLAELCRYFSRCAGSGTAFALRTKNDDIGPKLFKTIEAFLKPFLKGPGKALYTTLMKNKGIIEGIFSHTMGQLGANMDRDGVMQSIVWPFLEQYAHPLILSLAVKFSRQIQSIEKNDPDYMLKFMSGIMRLIAKHFKKMNEITIKLRESALYKVSADTMFKEFGEDLHPAIKEGRKATAEEVEEIRLKHVYRPFLKDLLDFIEFSSVDIPAPTYLKEPLFNLLADTLGPLCMGLMVQKTFSGDEKDPGKEPGIDKMESKILDNMQAAMDALGDYATAAKQADSQTGAKPTNAQQLLSDKLLKQCVDVVSELVQTIPEWFIQQFLSLNTVKKMTASQLTHLVKQMCHDWPLTKVVDRSAEVGLSNLCDGTWRGEGKRRKFIPNSQDITYDETALQRQHRLAEDEKRARENKCRTARIAADGLFMGARIPFQKMWAHFEAGMLWLCKKLFGKTHGPSIHNAFMVGFKHLGQLLSWIFMPLYYLSWQILYGIMKIQAGFAHRNLKHPAHLNLFFEMFKFLGKSVKDEAIAIKNKVNAQAMQVVPPSPILAAPAAAAAAA